ncbi:MAG TPA: hypothetical protein ENN46_03785 [Candidatus Woesearchaeota archaeon]|nr:hypothetical protein [Candidatus Woesearchaeota archaeon]
MAEKNIVFEKSSIKYKGFFEAKQLFLIIDGWLKDNNYVKAEKTSIQKNNDSIMYAQHKLEPFKKVSDYARFIIKIDITLSDVESVLIEKEGQKIPVEKGEVACDFTGLLETDYQNKWDTKPIYFFMKTVFDKFIFRSERSNIDSELKGEINDLMNEVKSFLNLYRF